MSLILLLGLAGAGDALYSRTALIPGEPVRGDQLHELAIADSWHLEGAIHGPARDWVGRIPAVAVPAQTQLRPEHFLPPGSSPGPEGLAPEGTVLVTVVLPVQTHVVRPQQRADVHARQADGSWCLLAAEALVVAIWDSRGRALTDPESDRAANSALVAVPPYRSRRPPTLALTLRNPSDHGPTEGPRCGVLP